MDSNLFKIMQIKYICQPDLVRGPLVCNFLGYRISLLCISHGKIEGGYFYPAAWAWDPPLFFGVLLISFHFWSSWFQNPYLLLPEIITTTIIIITQFSLYVNLNFFFLSGKILTQGCVLLIWEQDREREREKHRCKRETLMGCLLYMPWQE